MADSSSLSSDANSPPPPPPPTPTAAGGAEVGRKRRKLILNEEEEEEGEVNKPSSQTNNNEEEEEEEEEEEDDAKPIGNVVRVSWKGESKRNHFNGFQADGVSYQLEDTVLVSPEEISRPSVAIIKDITATEDGIVTMTGQRFYLAHMIEKETGGNWESCETRELFYSFDKSEFRAANVLHKCRVHFIPPNKKIPRRTEPPGFIVRKIYDAKSKKLLELLDPGYEDSRRREIDVLVQKTISQIPDWEDEIIGSESES